MGDSQPSRLPESFNQREVDILGLIKQGLTNQEIAQKLFLSLATVKWYNQIIFNKLGVSSRTQAIEKAREYGLIELQGAAPARIPLHPRHNLPARPNSFIGRKKELASLRTYLQTADIRLVTIVGPSGVGKTRLSLELAHQLASNYRDGANFVSLAPLNDPVLVASAIAQTFGIHETSYRSLQEALVASLRDRQLLLLLDNFEHVLPAARLVSELLAAAAGLKILATSRAPLELYGEHLFQLSPLPVPDSRYFLPPSENPLRFEGIRLFVERAGAVNQGFTLTAENAAAVVKICIRLDGLPLAIELAAARARMLSPTDMAAQFDGREGRFPFPMLAKGARDAPARHQTLHNAIAWSYDLLEAGEQALFRHLGVFSGGCTPEAAEAVCQATTDALESLVDNNLLIQSEAGGERRFGMLEMIRSFALEQLGLRGEDDCYRKRHVEYYLALAHDYDSKLNSLYGQAWIRALERERGNLRSVLAWGLAAPDMGSLEARVKAVRACLGAMQLPFSEQRQWLEKALSLLLGNSPPAVDCEQNLMHADLLNMLGAAAYFQGDYPAARAYLERCQSILVALGDKKPLAGTLIAKSWTLLALGDRFQAKASAEWSLALGRELEDSSTIAHALNHLGCLAWLEGNFDLAENLTIQSLDCFKEAHEPAWEAILHLNLGQVVQDRGDQARARQLYRTGLELSWKCHNLLAMGMGLEKAARSAATYGELGRAARLFAAAETLLQSIGFAIEPLNRPGHETYFALARNGLDQDEFDAAWAEGQALTLEQAVVEGLSKG